MSGGNQGKWTRRGIVTTGAAIVARGPAAANSGKEGGEGENETVGDGTYIVHDTVSGTTSGAWAPDNDAEVDYTADVDIEVRFEGEGDDRTIRVWGAIAGRGTDDEGREYRVGARLKGGSAFVSTTGVIATDPGLTVTPIPQTGDGGWPVRAGLLLTPADEPTEASISGKVPPH